MSEVYGGRFGSASTVAPASARLAVTAGESSTSRAFQVSEAV
ncbi:MAG: hypothetical protein ABSB01_16555 [Streptosporangiaceae bacterium]